MIKLCFDSLRPVFYSLIFVVPLLALGLGMRLAEPSDPIEVVYADCQWEGGKAKSLVLIAGDGEQYMVARGMRPSLWRDAEQGTLVPGDKLSVRLYPWIFRKAAATIEHGDVVYGTLEEWRATQARDAGVLFFLAGGLFFLACFGSMFFLWSSRQEIADIRKLMKKYKAR